MNDRTRTLFPTEAGEFVFRDPAGNEVMRVPWNQKPAAPVQPQQTPGVTESALKRGALNVAEGFSNTAGMAAEAFGNEELAQSFYDSATDFTKRAQAYQPTIGRIENVKSLGDAGIYAWEVLVENAPMLASMVIPGGTVTKAARLLGKGKNAASAAGASAAFLSNVGLQTGESAGIARDAGVSPVDLRVAGSGIGKAALDFVPLLGIAKRMGLAKNLKLSETMEKVLVGKLAEGGFIRRAVGHSSAIVAREVPTEVMQEAINIALQRALHEFSGDLTEEEKSQLLNAAAGATVFGLFGIPAAVGKPKDTGLPSPTQVPSEVNKQPDETVPNIDINIDEGGEGPTGGTVLTNDNPIVIENDGIEGSFGTALPSVPVGPALDPISADPIQKAAAQAALVNEPTEIDTAYYIDTSGQMQQSATQDPMLDAAEGVGPIAQGLQLTQEQLEVASKYPNYPVDTPSSPEAQSIAALHPGLQKLLELRNEIVSNDENYRSTDGVLKKAVDKKISTIDTRIATLQKRLGIQPIETEMLEATPEGLQAETEVVELPPAGLNASQKARLERLTEKEQIEGLSDAEYETYAELIGIATGEIAPVERRKQTPEELSELATITKEVRGDESVRSSDSLRETRARVGKPGTGMEAEKASAILEGIVDKMVFGPRVRLLSRQHPETVLRMHKFKSEMRGWWDPKNPGQVNILPTNHHTEKDLIATYLHETLAHYGLNAMYTHTEQLTLLQDLIKAAPPGFDVQAARAAIAEGGRGNILIEAEEYIASIAETISLDPNSGLVQQSWWKRFIALFKRKLRQITGKNIAWSDNDIVYILRDISKLLTGRVTRSNVVDTSHEQTKLREQIGMIDQELQAIDDAVAGRTGDIPQSLGLLDEFGGPPTKADVSRVKLRLKNEQAELRKKLHEIAGDGFINARSEMARVLGPEITETANNAVASSRSVWGARWAKMFFTPLQFAEQYNVPGSKEYLEFVQQWWARKRVLTDDAAQLANTYMQFGRRDQIKMSQAIMHISMKSDELQRKLTEEEIRKEFKELGMENDEALMTQWREMDKSFQDMIQQMRTGLETIAIRTQGKPDGSKMSREEATSLQRKWARARKGTAEDRKTMIQALGTPAWLRLLDIEEEIASLENRNYFPRMRFGTWTLTVRAKKDAHLDGKSYKGPTKETRGEVVHFETFESQRALEAAFEDMKKSFPETTYQMQMGKLSEAEFHFMGSMSPQLYEKLLGSMPELTDQQKEVLKELYLKQAPGRSFLRHLTKRKGVAGYSEDVLRVYSSYMMNAANHIARVEYHLDMNEQLGVINEHAMNAVPDARIAGVVREFFQEQYDYLMNPKNDLAHLRAMGFLWYLGANVKSAAVNLTQVPMVAYPYLASKYGDVKSSGAILSALKMVTRKSNGEVMPPEIRQQLERAVREGFVDESRATELAGLAEQGTLERLIPETQSGRAIAKASYYGAWLFQKAERFNREVTFVAAYNLAKQNGVSSQEEAFKLARQAVQTAMFEYAKWNRPAFMRGKKSVLFLFWQYIQGLSYVAFGGAGQGAALRTWMMLLLAGGMQGLPFAENILDLLDFAGTKTKERLGLKDPKVDLRADLRELALELTDRPDMIMHGLSRYYGLGPMHLLNMFEVPVPNVDISGSISAGRVIPGTDDFLGTSRDPSAKLGRTMMDVMGPVAAIPYQFWRAATDTNPDTWKVWERTLPVAFKNMSTAVRRGVRGGEEFRGGGQLAEFDAQDTEHRAELIAQFLGFATTRVNQRYEVDFSVQNVKQYWAVRRALVMENVAYARMAGDPEVIKDSMEALHRFNNATPDPMLRVNMDQLKRSLDQKFTRASLRERGIPSELLYRRLVSSMRSLYPESAVEVE